MGARLIAKGIDAEKYAFEYAAPVRRGLEGVFFLNDSLEKCARNYAPGKNDGVIVGTPTVNSQFMSGKSATSYIQTDIQETEEMSFFVIARAMAIPAGNPVPAADQPILLGNYMSGAWSGVVQWFSTQTSFSTNGGYGNDDASNINLGAGVTPNDVSHWGLYGGRVRQVAVDTKNFTNGLVMNRLSAPYGPRRLSGSVGRPLRVGSGYQTTQTGLWDMAAAFIYSVGLSDEEQATMVADIRAYAARRGLAV